MENEDKFLGVVNMQKEIEKDLSGDFQKETVEYLELQMTELQAMLDQGLEPDEYDRLLSFKAAVDASIRVVRLMWERFHVLPIKNP